MIRTKLIMASGITERLDEQINEFLDEEIYSYWNRKLIDIKYAACVDKVRLYDRALVIYKVKGDNDD